MWSTSTTPSRTSQAPVNQPAPDQVPVEAHRPGGGGQGGRLLRQPGARVVALRSGLGQTVVKLAGRVIDQLQDRPPDVPTDGVRVEVTDSVAKVDICVVTRLDHPCLEVAKAIQEQVGSQVQANTGMAAIISVDIIDIDLSSDEPASGPCSSPRPPERIPEQPISRRVGRRPLSPLSPRGEPRWLWRPARH
jgi:uncharacterized alkaline shock family protein YloU